MVALMHQRMQSLPMNAPASPCYRPRLMGFYSFSTINPSVQWKMVIVEKKLAAIRDMIH